MRFFTPQMYVRLNSDDDAQIEQAAREWESAFTRYKEHLRQIRDTMPAPVREVSELSLHDWELIESQAAFEQAVPAAPQMRLPLWLSFAAIGVRKQHEVIVLFYLLWDEVRTIGPDRDWDRELSPSGKVYWLYDEIDHVPSTLNQYVHRVLFSDGTVRQIPFSACYVYRFSSADLQMERAPTPIRARRKKSA